MKKIFPVVVLALVLAALSTSALWACNLDCGITTTPWGEPWAVCLTYPVDNAYTTCLEFNGLGFHDCAVGGLCRNGYPIA